MTTTTLKNEIQNRMPGLDGIRAIAILMVLCAHFLSEIHSNWLLRLLAKNGGYGVEIFFVLSGFLITILIIREEEKNGNFSIRNFYLRRTMRIFPPLIVYLIALIMLETQCGIKITSLDISACLFFLRNYFGQSQVTEHIWTLSIEEQYYILFPLFFILLKSNRARLTFLIILILFLSLWRQYCYSIPDMNLRRTDLRIEPMLVGSAFALSREAVIPKVMTNNFFSSSWAVFSSVVVASISLTIPKSDLLWLQSVRTTATYFAVATIINAVSLGNVRVLSNFLEFKPIIWLGRISYSLYIWQQLFSPFDNRTNLSWYTFFPQNIILACFLGVISFFFVESPVNSLKSKLFRTKLRVSQ